MNMIYKTFPGGKHKVLTLSYDDGKVEDRRLVKIFNQYNIKATLILILVLPIWKIGFQKKNGLTFIKDMR